MRYRVMLASLALAVTAGCSGTSTTSPNGATNGTTTGTTGTTAATSGSTGTTGSTTVNVTATSFKFTPQTLTVQQGQTVVWTNTDTIDHTVTSGVNGVPDGKFDQLLHPGETFSFTFDSAGTFPYFCRFHFTMGMVGTVTVSTAINTTGATGTTTVPTTGAGATTGTTATTGTMTTGTSATTGAGATSTTGTSATTGTIGY